MQLSPWRGLVERAGWYQCDREVTTGLAEDCVTFFKISWHLLAGIEGNHDSAAPANIQNTAMTLGLSEGNLFL
jgi:hypothetical protein